MTDIAIPSLERQKEIADTLAQMDNTIQLLQNHIAASQIQLDQLQAAKQAWMERVIPTPPKSPQKPDS